MEEDNHADIQNTLSLSLSLSRIHNPPPTHTLTHGDLKRDRGVRGGRERKRQKKRGENRERVREKDGESERERERKKRERKRISK